MRAGCSLWLGEGKEKPRRTHARRGYKNWIAKCGSCDLAAQTVRLRLVLRELAESTSFHVSGAIRRTRGCPEVGRVQENASTVWQSVDSATDGQSSIWDRRYWLHTGWKLSNQSPYREITSPLAWRRSTRCYRRKQRLLELAASAFHWCIKQRH